MKMTCGWCVLSVVVLVLAIIPPSDSAAYFTRVPPSKLYVQKGRTARFVWDYHVDHKMKEFSPLSPYWHFKSSRSSPRESIACDNGFTNWTFYIFKDACPPRLQSPTVRVSKESNATLVITNVTMADSGLYGCTLNLKLGHVASEVQLIVTDVMPHFTQVPPSLLYVAVGQSVKFVWDYVTSNKTADFDVQSPRWEVYTTKNGWETIGSDHGTSAWQWRLSPSCPARLQNPTRVSKASTASLVIYNVTSEDDGIYRCNLTLKDRPPISSISRLIVTAEPKFTSQISSAKTIAEGQNLQLLCSAVGPPSPNVTWVRIQGVTKVTVSHGKGNTSLHIANIRREHSGKYECQAVNNPNQRPVTTQTIIRVMYKPSIDYPKSQPTVTSVPGTRVTLRCMVSGFPYPNITWYKPNGELIRDNLTSFPGVSEVSLIIKDDENYGKYKCRLENIMGHSERDITVVPYESQNVNIVKQSKMASNYSSDPIVIVCITIIVVLFVTVFVLTVIITTDYRKASSKKTKSDNVIINMAEILVPSPTRDNNNQPINHIVYEEPINDGMTSSSHDDTSCPYDIPDIQFVNDTSTSTPRSGHYQELNIDNTTSHDYQSLQDNRTAVVNPTFIQSETSNPYEPLRKKKESQYQQLNRSTRS